jgi:hypothetical protein
MKPYLCSSLQSFRRFNLNKPEEGRLNLKKSIRFNLNYEVAQVKMEFADLIFTF